MIIGIAAGLLPFLVIVMGLFCRIIKDYWDSFLLVLNASCGIPSRDGYSVQAVRTELIRGLIRVF